MRLRDPVASWLSPVDLALKVSSSLIPLLFKETFA